MSNLITRTTELAMSVTLAYIRPGDTVVDATCGTGQDTVALAHAVEFFLFFPGQEIISSQRF